MLANDGGDSLQCGDDGNSCCSLVVMMMVMVMKTKIVGFVVTIIMTVIDSSVGGCNCEVG